MFCWKRASALNLTSIISALKGWTKKVCFSNKQRKENLRALTENFSNHSSRSHHHHGISHSFTFFSFASHLIKFLTFLSCLFRISSHFSFAALFLQVAKIFSIHFASFQQQHCEEKFHYFSCSKRSQPLFWGRKSSIKNWNSRKLSLSSRIQGEIEAERAPDKLDLHSEFGKTWKIMIFFL